MSSGLDPGFVIQSFHISETLKPQELVGKIGKVPEIMSSEEAMIPLTTPGSYFFVFKFGSVVFFNANEEDTQEILKLLQDFKTLKERTHIHDDLNLKDFKANSKKSVHIACLLLAQSTTLEYYEMLVEEILDKSRFFSNQLKTQGKFLKEDEDLLKFVGQCLHTHQEIVANLYILDSPDETWEDSELEKQFLELKGLLDIDARFRAVEQKIKMVQEVVEIIVDLFRSRRDTSLEMVIALLIIFEIVLTVILYFL